MRLLATYISVSLAQQCNPDENEDFRICQSVASDSYYSCLNRCPIQDMDCIGQCNRQYDVDLENCPCKSNCPSGCPCAGAYKCPCKPIMKSYCALENGAEGNIIFVQQDCNGEMSVEVSGGFLCTDRENCEKDNHGFHVHTSAPQQNRYGDLDCGSAGGHFGTEDQAHGRPTDAKRHYGDLGNVLVTDGVVNVTLTDSVISLQEGTDSYIGGRGLVLHALPDDFTGASGNAGARVACCAISPPENL